MQTCVEKEIANCTRIASPATKLFADAPITFFAEIWGRRSLVTLGYRQHYHVIIWRNILLFSSAH